MKPVAMYTDGSCIGNPGMGGWAAILIYQDTKKVLSGHTDYTTNNQMELMAVVKGLEALKEPCEVFLYTDSSYIITGIEHVEQWAGRGWRTSAKTPVANRELWEKYRLASKRHKVHPCYVQGHGTDDYNNECDRLAKNAAGL